MKILKKQISLKDGTGVVVLRPETSEDLWHIYNLLQAGDLVRTTTLRKVVTESSTGSTSSQKKRLQLTIQVEKVDFDPQAVELRLSGPTSSESDMVRMGSYHTLQIELAQNFSLEKVCWDQIYLDRIDEACQSTEKQSEVAAVVMQGTGLAHVCLVHGSLTVTKARIDTTIPKKRAALGSSSNHSKAMQKFFQGIYLALVKLPWEQLKCCLLASPGFVKDEFYKYMMTECVRREDRVLIENKRKFILCRASSGHKHALEEIFADPTIASQLEDTKMAREVSVLRQFVRWMDVDPDRALYGYAHVRLAQDSLAIEDLLLTDQLLRNSRSVVERRKYVKLVEDVRASGGTVHVFSSLHVSGKQLNQLSGIAAILRYPMPEIAAGEIEDENHEGGESGLPDEFAEDASDEEYDPEKRIREDMEDMGFN